MVVLEHNLKAPDRLMFAPDGLALLATEDSTVQVWPRWLDAHPRRTRKVQSTLERCAFGPDATRVYLYVSGNSRTRVLDLKRSEERLTGVPPTGPSWFHFDTAGGFILVSHNRGKLTRYDLDPGAKRGVRQRWSIDRPYTAIQKPEGELTALGSHYQFGAICPAAGTFVALEYRYGSGEPFDGLVVRSVADGTIVYRESITGEDGRTMRTRAGLTLSVHPSGRYFAYPFESRVCFRATAAGTKAPPDLTLPSGGRCRAVSFHPSGLFLAAVGDAGTVTLFDTASWQVAREFAWDIGELRSVCFSPDGTRAATIAVGKAAKTRKLPHGRAVVWDLDV
jgi:WD40 repeat protein